MASSGTERDKRGGVEDVGDVIGSSDMFGLREGWLDEGPRPKGMKKPGDLRRSSCMY